MMQLLARAFVYALGSFVFRLFIRLTIRGREHLPPPGSPLIIISNHFSWFEPALIVKHLPYKTVFIVAMELQTNPFFRLLAAAYPVIPIWRGQADRSALRQAAEELAAGGVIGIFPEGGIDPDLRPLTTAGQDTTAVGGRAYRSEAQLIAARPGAAYLALRSQAAVLPVGFVGTEQVLPNMRRLRRTRVTMTIGPVFGPLTLEPALRGAARRARLDALGDDMMQHIAALLPPENRGYYAR